MKLFKRLSRIIIEPCPTIDFAQKVNPIGRVVLEKVGKYSLGGPKPTIILRPKPKVSIWSGMGIEPTEISMIQPTVGVGEEGPKPRGVLPPPGQIVCMSPQCFM